MTDNQGDVHGGAIIVAAGSTDFEVGINNKRQNDNYRFVGSLYSRYEVSLKRSGHQRLSDTVAEYEAEMHNDPKYDIVQCIVSTGKASDPPDDWIAVQTPDDSDETFIERIYRAAVTVSDKLGLHIPAHKYTHQYNCLTGKDRVYSRHCFMGKSPPPPQIPPSP